MAQFFLHIAHGPHLQHAAQCSAGGGRNPGDHIQQAMCFLVDHGTQTYLVVVADLSQADGINKGLLAAHQLPGLTGIVVCTHALD